MINRIVTGSVLVVLLFSVTSVGCIFINNRPKVQPPVIHNEAVTQVFMPDYSCTIYAGLDVTNPFFLTGSNNNSGYGNFSSSVGDKYTEAFNELRPDDEDQVVFVSSDQYFLDYPGVRENELLKVISWKFIDYGWGVIPSEIEVTVDGEPVPVESLDISYRLEFDNRERNVFWYMVNLDVEGKAATEEHVYGCTLHGLIWRDGDWDGDGLPDTFEVTSDPIIFDTDDDGLSDYDDPCPRDPDIDDDGTPDGSDEDMNNDGMPDPPVIWHGFNDTFKLPDITTSLGSIEFPEVQLIGYTLENDITNYQLLHIWLSEHFDAHLRPFVEDVSNWELVTEPECDLAISRVELGTSSLMSMNIVFNHEVPEGTRYTATLTIDGTVFEFVMSR